MWAIPPASPTLTNMYSLLEGDYPAPLDVPSMYSLLEGGCQAPCSAEKSDSKSAGTLSDGTVFLLGTTALFVLTSAFAHVTRLYREKPAPETLGQDLSSYVVCLPIAHILYTTAGVTVLSGARWGWVFWSGWMIPSFVGIGWSLVQECAGTEVTLTSDSLANDWGTVDLVLFGTLLLVIAFPLAARLREVFRQRGQILHEVATNRNVHVGIGVTLLFLILGFVPFPFFKVQHHIHHWFIGMVLALSMTGTEVLACKVLRDLSFGLFIHGAAAWGQVGGVFE